MTTIGDLIRSHCHAVHLSQTRLAARAGYNHSHISRIVAGTRQPSRETVLAIAAAIGVDGLTAAQTDELLASAGHMPRDPASLLSDEPELVAVLAVLRRDDLPDTRRVGIRAMLAALADLAQGDASDRTVQESPSCLPGAAPAHRIPEKGSGHDDALLAAITSPHGGQRAA